MPFNRYLNGVIRQAHFRDDVVGNDELGASHPKHLTFLYDFATLGGGAGAIILGDENGDAQVVPAGSIITNAYISVQTAVTSGGSATVAFGIVGNTDAFKAATGKASLGTDVVLAGTNDLPITDAVPMQVALTIATADLTAGKIRVFVEYIERGYIA